MDALTSRLTLNNGTAIPRLGIGTWRAPSGIVTEEAVLHALRRGYRHIDTAAVYGNERDVGNALRKSGVPREDVFLTTKLWNDDMRGNRQMQAFEESMERLGTDYVDLYLIHWPQPATFVETWLQMEKLYQEGLVKAIGVCNFNKHHLEYLMKKATILPMVNQFEIHPLFTQDALVNYCRAYDITPIAYTPVGRMHDCLIKSNPVQELSKTYGITPVQIILRWHYQLGHVAIPRTLSTQHFDDIFSIDTFELSYKDICWISSLNDNIRLRYNPDTVDFSRT